jgi:hypothetical protein
VLAESHRWTVETIRDGDTFCRLLVHGPEDLLVDIALDSAPGRPATVSLVGPTFAIEELAGRKVAALFDRAAARDFVDVYMLAQRFSKDTLPVSTARYSPTWSRTLTATVTLSSTWAAFGWASCARSSGIGSRSFATIRSGHEGSRRVNEMSTTPTRHRASRGDTERHKHLYL